MGNGCPIHALWLSRLQGPGEAPSYLSCPGIGAL